jgi:hypothetical protein
MRLLPCAIVVAVCAGLVTGAHGAIIFSNVSIGGSLATGAYYETGATDIDFILPDAIVGDPTDPRRDGDLVISYEAESVDPLVQDQLTLQVLGALSGSGTISLTETVEDLINPGVIASYSVVLDENSQLPHVAVLDFDRTSVRVRVEKTLTLEAIETSEFDLANVSLIEQTHHEIPEPAAGLALMLPALLLGRRR